MATLQRENSVWERYNRLLLARIVAGCGFAATLVFFGGYVNVVVPALLIGAFTLLKFFYPATAGIVALPDRVTGWMHGKWNQQQRIVSL